MFYDACACAGACHDRAPLSPQVVHIKYRDTTAQSLATCRAVCEATGLAFSGEYERRVNDYLAASKAKRAALKAKGGAKGGASLHEYSLEEFGLSTDAVVALFKDYIDKYC